MVTLLVLVACGPSADTGKPAGETALPEGPTWYDDVAPILAANCIECHVDGGSAPFALDSYEATVAYDQAIVAATAARTMPPYNVDASGACQTYQDARWLTDEEIALLAAWVDAGEIEGSGTVPAPPALPTLAETDFTVDIGGDYTPDPTVEDDYRCFVMDLPVSGRQYITGYHTDPTWLPEVHHATLYTVLDQGSTDFVREMDAADAGLGYDCPRNAGIPAFQVIALWNIGTPPTNFPEGTGIPINADHPIVVREHYYTGNGTGPDRTQFHFNVETSVELEASYTPYSNEDISLPPGQTGLSSSADFLAGNIGDGESMTFWGVAPHTHQLATEMLVTRNPDAADAGCLEHSPRWDYHWQQTFFYGTPVTIAATDTIRVECTWDTTSVDHTIEFGSDAGDEMCLVAFYATEG